MGREEHGQGFSGLRLGASFSLAARSSKPGWNEMKSGVKQIGIPDFAMPVLSLAKGCIRASWHHVTRYPRVTRHENVQHHVFPRYINLSVPITRLDTIAVNAKQKCPVSCKAEMSGFLCCHFLQRNAMGIASIADWLIPPRMIRCRFMPRVAP